VGRKSIKRGAGKTAVACKDFRLAEEIDYIQGRAAEHDRRLVTVGPLVLFSAETGDAWLLDPADHLAARLARAMAIQRSFTSRKPIPVSPSAGRAITRFSQMLSCSPTATQPESPPS
jgi:hypothetical protein